MKKVRYLITKKDFVKIYVIKSLIKDKMAGRDTAEVLSLNKRQIKRLFSKFIGHFISLIKAIYYF